jgi:hypothetical protein
MQSRCVSVSYGWPAIGLGKTLIPDFSPNKPSVSKSTNTNVLIATPDGVDIVTALKKHMSENVTIGNRAFRFIELNFETPHE